ncbi:hypothetical protein ACFYVL_14300 [Streptomyces sp. NPDC004111]|uniref:hypothetical protein n=1 Tax=Streptomyces sp. NPDC004111 TaxID=3364690 RepID=UPI00367BB324
MDFEEGEHVTPRKRPLPGQLRLFGRVTGWGTCPFEGIRLVMVRWPGAHLDTAHRPDELVHTD